jgi:hypothetical protein
MTSPVELEIELLSREARSSAARLSELLDDSFFEIGQSGATFRKADIVIGLPLEASSSEILRATEMQERSLGDGLIQLIYRCEAADSASDAIIRYSWRSSIWRKSNSKWQLLFHQGTMTKP